ncbi:MAG TPA: GntG family PLP-dependent aldolase, partial [Candidatus Saccharimonadales bacterium]|nr:GntG family PLP-dependent aldolase [Candidatus Saccharimonadales bacterium]
MSTSWIDLRSDTVTLPSDQMRRAMASAEVGDDVYGEDPTINRLEARAAEIFGREAAIFVPSGTMGNQIAIKLHTRPGQEILCEERGHIFNWEMAMLSWFSGCVVRPVSAPQGILSWDLLAPKVAPSTYYVAQTGLISMENTHNMAGGTVTPVVAMEDICAKAHERGLPVHLDGARIFNAATYLGKPVAEITRRFDSVMFCLSKGLGAPVGSLLVGAKDFIAQARSVRKALGGGMRQAGILAAAGLIALEQGPARLHEDHETARLLAEGLAEIPGVEIDMSTVQTNVVICDVSATGKPSAEIVSALKSQGVLAGTVNPQLIRFVTHLNVS